MWLVVLGTERDDRHRRRAALLPRLCHHRRVQGAHTQLSRRLHNQDPLPQAEHRPGGRQRPPHPPRHPGHPPEERLRQRRRLLLPLPLPSPDTPLLRLPLR